MYLPKCRNFFFFVILSVALVSCEDRLFPGKISSGELNGEDWSPEAEHVEHQNDNGLISLFFCREGVEMDGEELSITCVPNETGLYKISSEPIDTDECFTHCSLIFAGIQGDTQVATYQMEFDQENTSFISIDDINGKKITGSFEILLANLNFNPDRADEFPEEIWVSGDFESKERK